VPEFQQPRLHLPMKIRHVFEDVFRALVDNTFEQRKVGFFLLAFPKFAFCQAKASAA
jgi:hypothetical protein